MVVAHIEYYAVANLIRRTKRLLEPGKVRPLSRRRDLAPGGQRSLGISTVPARLPE
jgi:hypothetical protein